MNAQKKLLVLFPYFSPAWRAGGPVQSLNNMVEALSQKLSIYVLTGAYEVGETTELREIKLAQWNNVKGGEVRYLQKKEQRFSVIKSIINYCNPDLVYLNGMYSLRFVVFPLLMNQLFFKRSTQFFLSPRGMLQEGALKIKPFKKKIFISTIKFLRLQKGINWHATDIQESDDIKKIFGQSSKVFTVPNIPKKPLPQSMNIKKQPGELRLVYLSLITEKKNLLTAIKMLAELSLPISFDIFGPIKDKRYWEKCLEKIKELPQEISVNYRGDISPENVQETLSNYHVMLFPTKGENFGHAIYESFSVGRPVIISTETPWKNLQQRNAGFDISLQNPEQYKEAIKSFYLMDQKDFDHWSSQAHKVAFEYYHHTAFESMYLQMFGCDDGKLKVMPLVESVENESKNQ